MIAAVAAIVIGAVVIGATIRHMRRPDVIDLRGIVAAHTAPVGRL